MRTVFVPESISNTTILRPGYRLVISEIREIGGSAKWINAWVRHQFSVYLFNLIKQGKSSLRIGKRDSETICDAVKVLFSRISDVKRAH